MIEVTCAIIVDQQRVFVAQRPLHKQNGGLWEFPGGKVHPDESATQCLIREIKEELDVDIELVSQLTPTIYHHKNLSIKLIPFISKICNGTITLHEHTAYWWADRDLLTTLNWSPADIPVLNEIIKLKLV
jgi:8-oxo-dGTP diphosphatase